MRPLIFVPDIDGKHCSLTDVGLGQLEKGAERDVRPGPNGEPGLLFYWLDPKNRDIRIAPDEQTWLPAAGHGGEAGRYIIGVWNDKPPTEAELLRPDHRRGAFVQMADRAKWLVTTPDHLDRFPVPQPDGSLQWVVDESFNDVFTQLERIKATRLIDDGDGSQTFIYGDVDDFYFLCDVLAINYRITPELVGHLRLLTESSIREFVAALLSLKMEPAT